MERDIKAALSAGYDAHLTKPIDPQNLSAMLQKLAAKNRS
jgi:CheY-like chemotaxis protein